MKVLTVVGTRPEAIKMAPIIKELARHPGEIQSVVCATAQHRQMLDQVLEVFDIEPDYDLDAMLPNQTLSQLTANILTRLDQVVAAEQPDWVLVQGDTTTVMVASLVAYYHRARVGHVEAGLRTEDKWQPYPEEINRRLADVLADLYFAPTEHSRENLLREGVSPEAILVTGNTVVDALLMTVNRLKQEEKSSHQWSRDGRRLIVVTAHRRESFGEPMIRICRALSEIATLYSSGAHLVYPVHPNPNVWRPVHEMLGGIPNITLTEPLGYYDFVRLMSRAYLILTDSGGLQEDLSITGLEDQGLQAPVAMFTSPDTQHLYVADAGLGHVVQLTKEGALVRQFLPPREDEGLFQDMKDVWVDETRGEIVVLTSEGLFVAPLEQPPSTLQ